MTKEKVKADLADASAICITTDGWTSKTNTSYITITAHFINSDVQYRSVCLGCEEFNERHTANNLSSCLRSKVEEWQLENKVAAVISDNAANIVSAIRECNYRHLPCFAHSVNLIVQCGLKKIAEVQKKIKAIVEHFKRSSYAQEKLISIQKQMDFPQLKLKQDVVTRWNSTYNMMKRFLQIKEALISTLALLQIDIDQLTPREWIVVEKSVEVLEIFSDVTVEISSENFISISKVLIFISSMKETMFLFKNNTDWPEQVLSMVGVFIEEIDRRFSNYKDNELITQSALLDPRIKHLALMHLTEREKELILNSFKNKVVQITILGTQSTTKDNTTVFSTRPSSSLLWKRFDEQYNIQRSIVPNPQTAGIIEYDRYMKEPVISRIEDPLAWWKEHKTIYPHLFKMVKKRLCICATSVPCERIFSKAGLTISDRRTNLAPSKVAQILFLNHNI